MTLWHYQRNCAPYGCVETKQLKQLAAAGELQPDDLVRKDGTEAWVRARKLQGLFACDPVRQYIKPPEGTWEHRATRALEQEDWDAALKIVTKVIERQPEHAQAIAIRGGVRLVKQDPDRGRADLEYAHQLDPENAAAFAGFAALAIMTEDWQKCVDACTQAILRDPEEDKDLLGMRGLGNTRIGKFEAATADLDRVLDIDPLNVTALQLKITIAQQQKDWAACLDGATDLLTVDPNDKLALQMRSLAHQNIGDHAAAKADADQAFAIDPNDESSLQMQASYALQKQSYRECDALTTRLLESNPEDATILGLRGLARFHLRDFKASASDINKAIKFNPDEAYLWEFRAGLAQSMGDTKICIRAATEALNRGSDSPWVRVLRGNALIVAGNNVSAEADFEACLQADPTHAYALLGKAVISLSNATAPECRSRNLRESHLDTASRCIKSGIATEPDNPVFHKVMHAVNQQWDFLERGIEPSETPVASEGEGHGKFRNFAMDVVKDIGIQLVSSLILPF